MKMKLSQPPVIPKSWALLLASYEYTIVYWSTTKYSNADAMSWLPLLDKPKTTPVPAELVLMIEKLDEAPISAKQMAAWTQRDVVLSRVLRFMMLGWPKLADDDLSYTGIAVWSCRSMQVVYCGAIQW